MAKILIVDDSAYARHILKNALEKGGFEVIEASSGTEALEQIPLQKPDLVTMDLLMPGMQGQELLQHIKISHPELKVIVVTADIQEDTRRELLDAGADAFINKPVSSEVLLEAVKRLI
ncbi:MAG: response regulator [Anaerolineae bacterium]|jgi:CheY-like chemotaxis protein|nr:MAG: response regulator [Anaerolineae bacterium]